MFRCGYTTASSQWMLATFIGIKTVSSSLKSMTQNQRATALQLYASSLLDVRVVKKNVLKNWKRSGR